MRVPELKSLARDRGLRNYSLMRKAELVTLLQNSGTLEGPRAPAPRNRPLAPPPPTRTWEPIDDRKPRKLSLFSSPCFPKREKSGLLNNLQKLVHA